MNYPAFCFDSYTFDANSKRLDLHYSYQDGPAFTETYIFDFAFVDYDAAVLDRAVQNLFFMAGISYYKAFLAPVIAIKAGQIDQQLSIFLGKTYQKGLGEFFYVNQRNPHTPITFPVTTNITLNMLSVNGTGQLIGLGGGKDSLVSVELLREQPGIATWSVGHQSQLAPLVKRTALPHYAVERTWDRQLLQLNEQGALNGHVPISAILACVGTVVAILAGKQDVVVSNENSANEPTLTYQGVDINHQYSKSLEFEQDYQQLLQAQFGGGLRYYSLLRPLSELRISELFANNAFAKYQDVFSSCNRAFTHDSPGLYWCGECPKCAFVFLALTPFVAREKLEKLWGKNLLLDSRLTETYRSLLGIGGDKPLECVGEIQECRQAMRLAQQQYPELSAYSFDLTPGYDYKTIHPHCIPQEVYALVADVFTP